MCVIPPVVFVSWYFNARFISFPVELISQLKQQFPDRPLSAVVAHFLRRYKLMLLIVFKHGCWVAATASVSRTSEGGAPNKRIQMEKVWVWIWIIISMIVNGSQLLERLFISRSTPPRVTAGSSGVQTHSLKPHLLLLRVKQRLNSLLIQTPVCLCSHCHTTD